MRRLRGIRQRRREWQREEAPVGRTDVSPYPGGKLVEEELHASTLSLWGLEEDLVLLQDLPCLPERDPCTSGQRFQMLARHGLADLDLPMKEGCTPISSATLSWLFPDNARNSLATRFTRFIDAPSREKSRNFTPPKGPPHLG